MLHAENVDGSEELTPFMMLVAIKTYLEENHAKMNFFKAYKYYHKSTGWWD